MDQSTAISIFECLSSGVRLDVFRLLVKAGPSGLVAGEISAALGLPPTNLSFHLKVLTQSRLLTVAQQGRYQRYRADMALMTDLIAYITAECCVGVAGPEVASQFGELSVEAICPQCADPSAGKG